MATGSRDLPIIGDSFAVGYRFQRYWDTPMANAFFFGELGAGVFLVAAWLNNHTGMLAGLLITCVLKSGFHLSHMGVPYRSWKAILRPDRSWISRGLLSIVFYAGFGFTYLALASAGLGWGEQIGAPEGLINLLKWLAVAAALVVSTYQGFAMSHSTAIALWNSAIMPISSLVYALTAGVFVNLLMGWNTFLAEAPDVRAGLLRAAIVLCVAIGVVLLSLLHGAHHGSPGGRKSVELLTRTFFAKWFYIVTWGLGVVLPVVLLATARDTYAAVVLAAISMLAGYYSYRLLLFKAGLYEPILSFRV